MTSFNHPHTITIESGQWALWRPFCIRSAGFPAQQIHLLADSACATGADHVLTCEVACAHSRAEAKTLLGQALDGLRAQGEWANKPVKNRYLNAVRAVTSGSRPTLVGDAAIDAALTRYREALDRRSEATAAYAEAFARSLPQIEERLLGVVRDERFREAVIWQNRQALHGSMAFADAEPGDRIARQRRKMISVVKYLQRYCTKNDTIGFFGPVAWGQFMSQGAPVNLRVGASLLANRSLYFEGWAIDALAEVIGRDLALRPWMAPRRIPYIDVEGDLLYMPMTGPIRLSPKQASVLQACDGVQTAREIARKVAADPRSGVTAEREVYDVLEQLVKQRRIAWTFDVPLVMRPEQALEAYLDRITDEELRRRAKAPLAQLMAARDEVARSAGDAQRLDRAMAGLEERFTRITAKEAARSPGQIYAARTLVYEDCVRDLDLHIGPEIAQALSAPLALVLTSARWLTHEASKLFTATFRRIYADLVRRARSPRVGLADFWLMANEYCLRENLALLEPVRQEFQRRWAEILSLPEGQRLCQFETAALRPEVQRLFQAPQPGWPTAGYHSPDVLIAAASAEAILQGDYQLVLGEIHAGINSLGINALLSHHPAPDELIRAASLDAGGPRVELVVSKDWGRTARVCQGLIASEDYRLLLGRDSFIPDTERCLPAGALLLEEVDGQLWVFSRDGQHRFTLLDILGQALTPSIINALHIAPPSAHTPRLVFDRVVVHRETWRLSVDELPFMEVKDEATLFVSVRRWMRQQGFPRYVFAKVPLEQKPFFVDFDSPALVEILAGAVRKAHASDHEHRLLSIVEMLPAFEHLWLTDASGQRYTCEFRIAALDLTLPRHPTAKEGHR